MRILVSSAASTTGEAAKSRGCNDSQKESENVNEKPFARFSSTPWRIREYIAPRGRED